MGSIATGKKLTVLVYAQHYFYLIKKLIFNKLAPTQTALLVQKEQFTYCINYNRVLCACTNERACTNFGLLGTRLRLK